jgi:hypothetical protein
VTDFLDEKRRQINARLDELKPLVEEYGRLDAAAAALASLNGSATPGSEMPATRHRPRGSASQKPKAAAKPSRQPARGGGRQAGGRRKGSGPRAAQALGFVQGQAGITIPELAAKMGIKQNYLYRVLPSLQQEGKIEKKGRGWHPAP